MVFLSRSLATGLLTLISISMAPADKWIIIGDSLSKEYSVEFPALFPLRPAAWSSRNWIELLFEHRSQQVDIGSYGLWPDSRLLGHEYNWAFPGSQTKEWVEILEANALTDPSRFLLRRTFESQLKKEADRVVIFLGGNDLNNNYGTYSRGTDSTAFINLLESNVTQLVDYVKKQTPGTPIVLVNMPDVGVTPSVQTEHPDLEGRARMTALTAEVNTRLRFLAESRNIGYADIFSLTKTLSGPDLFVVGGWRFIKGVDPSDSQNGSTYLFSPDGFHPNSAAHLLFANEIVRAFNEHYPALTKVADFSTEEMLSILELNPDMSFDAWAEAYGMASLDPLSDTDGDGSTALLEFAFGGDPRSHDSFSEMAWTLEGGDLMLHYATRVNESIYYELIAESSDDLDLWTAIPLANLTSVDSNQRLAKISTAISDQQFIRIQTVLKP